jgi:hypothetical protein
MSSWKARRQSCGRSVAPISNLCGAYPRRADFRDRAISIGRTSWMKKTARTSRRSSSQRN